MNVLSSVNLIPFQSRLLHNGVTVWWIRAQRRKMCKDTVYISGQWISLAEIFLLNLFTPPPPVLVSLSHHVIFYSLIHWLACLLFPWKQKAEKKMGFWVGMLSSHFTSYIRCDGQEVNDSTTAHIYIRKRCRDKTAQGEFKQHPLHPTFQRCRPSRALL